VAGTVLAAFTCASLSAEVTLLPDPEIGKLLSGLGAGNSALLPPPKIVGDLNDVARHYGLDKNGPGVRDYCIKMVWMPDRKRAIYYGANHGAPHRLNDVWEYDLPANTWNCLYGPDANKHGTYGDWSDVDPESAETKTGIIRTKRGGPAIIPHSWWNMTYDPGLKAMLTPCTWSMSNDAYFKLLQAGKHKPPLWSFFPEKGRWEPIVDSRIDGKPPGYENARAMEYLPELGGTLWIKSDGMWLYNSVSNAWRELKPNGGDLKAYQANMPDREQVAAYLPDRGIVVAHSRHGKGFRTTHYDIAKNEWKVAAEGEGPGAPPGGFDASTGFVYDSAGKVCLLHDPGKEPSFWAYDPAAAQWNRLQPQGAPLPTGRNAMAAFYDVAQNVFVIPGRWMYRHRKVAQ
jgi:hypothetical protein